MSKIILSFVVGLALGASLIFVEPVSVWSKPGHSVAISDPVAVHAEEVTYGEWNAYLSLIHI